MFHDFEYSDVFAFLDTFRMVFDILLIFHVFLNRVYIIKTTIHYFVI